MSQRRRGHDERPLTVRSALAGTYGSLLSRRIASVSLGPALVMAAQELDAYRPHQGERTVPRPNL